MKQVIIYNWTFGSYFSYGQDLGGPGKDLAVIFSQQRYNCSTIQFTMTPTSFSTTVTQPAYDFEILYFPLSNGNTGPATCVSAVTLDITQDFDDNEGQEPGTDLRVLCNMNKGIFGD